jgi:hypothetical protein
MGLTLVEARMTRVFVLSVVGLVACGPKPAPPGPMPPAVVDAVPVDPLPLPEPEPVPAAPVQNIDLDVSITYADGTSRSGRVIRVERSNDFEAATGYTDRPDKLKVALSAGGTAADVDWSDLTDVRIAYATADDAVSCQYDSSVTPWVYSCVLGSTSTATTRDGRRWDVTGRHKWRLTFQDGQTTELWLYKLAVRRPDDGSGPRGGENPGMYEGLRSEVRDLALRSPVRVTVSTRVGD